MVSELIHDCIPNQVVLFLPAGGGDGGKTWPMPSGYWEITMRGQDVGIVNGIFPLLWAKYMTGFHWIRLCARWQEPAASSFAKGNLSNNLARMLNTVSCAGTAVHTADDDGPVQRDNVELRLPAQLLDLRVS